MPVLKYRDISPKIHRNVFIADNAYIIGDVHVGERSGIWYGCVIRGDVNHIRIGEEVNIQDGTVIHVSRFDGPTIIGDGVTIGHRVLLHACTLEENSFVGMAATVMDRAVLEEEAMLAAGALLTPGKVVKRHELWAGTPAKKKRDMTEEEIKYLKISRQNYVDLAAEYLGMH